MSKIGRKEIKSEPVSKIDYKCLKSDTTAQNWRLAGQTVEALSERVGGGTEVGGKGGIIIIFGISHSKVRAIQRWTDYDGKKMEKQ